MAENQTVDLIIRSKLQGDRDLKKVATDLADIQKAIERQTDAASKGESSIDELKVSMQQLADVQADLSNIERSIVGYDKIGAALEKARDRARKAATAYTDLQAKLSAQATVTDRQQQRLIQLSMSQDRANASVTRLTAEHGKAGAALRQAGVDTSNLAAAQGRLHQQAAQIGASMVRTRTAIDGYRASTREAARAQSDLGASGTRIFDGLRGRIAAAAAAFVGYQGAVRLARGAIDAQMADEAARVRIGVAFDTNDQKIIGEQFEYVKGLADSLGIGLQTLVEQFGSYAIAGKNAGYTNEQIRYSFEQLTAGMRVNKLSADQIGRAFTQVQQILSKAKPEMEDLRTIAESGFAGVQQMMAKGLRTLGVEGIRAGSELQDMFALMQKGALDSNTAIFALATQIENQLGPRVESATTGLAASFGRLQTATFGWFKTLAEGGFGRALQDSIDKIALSLRSAEGTRFAEVISGGFAAATTAATWLLGGLNRVREATLYVVAGVEEMFVRLSSGSELLFSRIDVFATRAWNGVQSAFRAGITNVIGLMERGLRAIGAADTAASLRALAEGVAFVPAAINDSSQRILDDAKARIADIRKLRDEMVADIRQPPAAVPRTVTARPDRPRSSLGNGDAKARERVRKEVESIEKSLESLEQRTGRAEAETLADRLAVIERSYSAVGERIAKVGGATGKALGERFQQALDSELSRTRDAFERSLAEREAALLASVEKAEAAAAGKEKSNLDARLTAVRTGYEAMYRDIAKMRDVLSANNRDTATADDAKARIDATRDIALAQEEVRWKVDQTRAIEQEMGAILDRRRAQLTEIGQLEEQGTLTAQTAADQRAAVLARAKSEIDALRTSSVEWLQSIRDAGNATEIDLLIASLSAASATAGQFNDKLFQIKAGLRQDFAAGATDGLIDGLTEAAQAGEDFKGTIQNVGRAFASFAADFLKRIATMILQQQVLNALKSMGAFGGAAGAVAGVAHTGGVVGSFSKGRRTRSVDPSWFAAAPRYHAGGVAGLAPDEYATVLQKNEEVLAADSPRNILNGGGAGAGGQGGGSTRFVLVDDRSKVPEAMASAEGEKVIVEHLRRNAATLKQLVRG